MAVQKRQLSIVENLKVREATEEGSESRVIEGYALKFGVRSVLLNDWWSRYYEILEPGCITREMLDQQDIKLTMFHDRQLILARSNKGKGTLNYEVDEVGVKFWAEMPHTSDGDKALELVQRGDIAGCSFCYSTDEEDSENAVSYERLKEGDGDDETLLRHVKRIDNVYDFTLAADPAFEQTEVSKREVDDALKQTEREEEEEGGEPEPQDEDDKDNEPEGGQDNTDADDDEDKEAEREAPAVNVKQREMNIRHARLMINENNY